MRIVINKSELLIFLLIYFNNMIFDEHSFAMFDIQHYLYAGNLIITMQ